MSTPTQQLNAMFHQDQQLMSMIQNLSRSQLVRQPLTESMIKAGLDELEAIRQTEFVGDYELIKRLLEAAHGIGEKT